MTTGAGRGPGTIVGVPPPLHVHRYGPDGPPRVLALHGLTGHGQRWQRLSDDHLPGVAVAAPDLIGHGRSPWAAPWSIDANAAALAALLEADARDPVAVVAHSFGAAVALQLAAARPELVSALVLLDPAVGLDGAWMQQIAEAMFADPDYTDAAEARNEKSGGSWGDVDDDVLDAEIDEHLIALPGGRVGWRICIPAMLAYWSELARDPAVPRTPIPTTVVRARHTHPRYVDDEFVERLGAGLGTVELVEFDCNHMVPHAKPAETAALIRAALGS